MIVAIAAIAEIFAIVYIIISIAEKVNEYILSPIIKKVKGCFSHKSRTKVLFSVIQYAVYRTFISKTMCYS
ncbi:MAG: hypothetical protein ACR5K2_01295 [Wolbachia sp.]